MGERLSRFNGHADDTAAAPIVLRSALEIAGRPSRATWLLKPYIERGAVVLMVGAEGTYKSFLALDWSMQLAMRGEAVVFLHAEGRGLWKRLRAWCQHHYPQQGWLATLNGVPFLAVERPLNLTAASVVLALTEAIDALDRKPGLIVVDTMTRNSDGSIERSNEDALMYLNGIDQLIRARYGCAVVLIHHIGHAARDRARGPFALIGSTDANFLLERPDLTKPLVTVRSGRMKDCEPPPPFELEAHVVELLDEFDESGKAETSVILKGTGQVPASRAKPTGKRQRELLADLERRAALPDAVGIWSEGELRQIARGLGMHKGSARDAVVGLRQLGYLAPTVGGSRLAHLPLNGTNGTNRDENTNPSRGVGDEKDESPLGLVLRPTLRLDPRPTSGNPENTHAHSPEVGGAHG